METQIFDRETILDLVVNFIPLGIILFFVAMFVMITPWGFDSRETTIMLALMLVPFLALAVLTYLSAVAIAGDEQRAPVYSQGQAGLEGAKTRHEQEVEAAAAEAGETTGEESNEEASDDNTIDDATGNTTADDDTASDDAVDNTADNDAVGDAASDNTATDNDAVDDAASDNTATDDEAAADDTKPDED